MLLAASLGVGYVVVDHGTGNNIDRLFTDTAQTIVDVVHPKVL